MELIIGIAVIAVLAWFFLGAGRRVKQASYESQLARMFDKAAADRLIKYEQIRDPKLSRREAAKRALERAEYDRGR